MKRCVDSHLANQVRQQEGIAKSFPCVNLKSNEKYIEFAVCD
jgi:hypothetical protein